MFAACQMPLATWQGQTVEIQWTLAVQSAQLDRNGACLFRTKSKIKNKSKSKIKNK